ncbi:protein detoxification 7 [Quercus suber]|uniref:Protein detoxification 7 n=1 Tax=Quercus suber TaxID=58331 RepID=A0AAW0KM36_QUESU
MDIHRQITNTHRTRSNNLTYGRHTIQSLILPMLFSSFAALCFHIPFCWILVFKSKFGSSTAALASASS